MAGSAYGATISQRPSTTSTAGSSHRSISVTSFLSARHSDYGALVRLASGARKEPVRTGAASHADLRRGSYAVLTNRVETCRVTRFQEGGNADGDVDAVRSVAGHRAAVRRHGSAVPR